MIAVHSSAAVAIELRRLHRFFGSLRAVNDVSFEVTRGQVFGFIGPNGAGKTTSMRILATLDLPTAGDALVDGFSVINDPDHVRRRLGFMPDAFGAYSNVNCAEYLDFYARAYGLAGRERHQAIDRVMRFTGLDVLAQKPMSGLSKGMKQRLCLGRAIIHNPTVLILDEPAAGLDPRARIQLREMIRSLADNGKTILISSHILTELAEMCDVVGIIEQGRLIAVGSVHEIERRVNLHRVVELRVLERAAELGEWLRQRPDVANLTVEGNFLRLEHQGEDRDEALLLREIVTAGYEVFHFGAKSANLEDVFMQITKGLVQISAVNQTVVVTLPLAAPSASRWQRFEAWLGDFSDRLNPILVKETRQSLKSTQFAITFFLLLTGGWLWSLVGVATNSPAIYYRPSGPSLLIVYYVGLAFPLLVIVPFVAFRSLVGEREDGTYELLSISTLTPRQIITGKLGSAMLQMMIYLSALSPCIAFTYLLRGIDIVTIALLLLLLVGLSLLLSSAGILVGTVTRVRHWNAVLSVFIILGLLLAYWMFAAMFLEGLYRETLAAPADMPEFWQGVATFTTAGLGYVALLLTAAAARITFKSENRSTPLRWVMLALQVLAVGWAVFYATAYEFTVSLMGLCIWSAINWAAFGLFVNGETAFLSDRVRRRLPQSFLGRLLFTWMNPGPRTGYIFVCSALGSVVLLILGMELALGQFFNRSGGLDSHVLACVALLSWAYVTIYLGLGNWLIAVARRILRLDMITAVIVQPLLLFAAIVGPLMFQLAFTYDAQYTPLQIGNPFWTIIQATQDTKAGFGASGYFNLGIYSPLVLLVVFVGMVIFVVHLVATLRELTYERVAVPERVREEEQRLAPPAPVPGRTSPWDDTAKETRG